MTTIISAVKTILVMMLTCVILAVGMMAMAYQAGFRYDDYYGLNKTYVTEDNHLISEYHLEWKSRRPMIAELWNA